MPLPFSHFTTAAVQADLRRYRDLLVTRGKTLSDAALIEIGEYARRTYASRGRVDFAAFGTDYNVGSSSTAYTFHGRQITLTNGPTWWTDGLEFDGTNRATMAAPSQAASVSAVTLIAVFKSASATNDQTIFGGRRNAAPSWAPFMTANTALSGAAMSISEDGSGGSTRTVSTGASVPINQFSMVAASADLAGSVIWSNGVWQAVNNTSRVAIFNNNPTWGIGSRYEAQSQAFIGRIAFIQFDFAPRLNTTTAARIFSDYKATIGGGLGL